MLFCFFNEVVNGDFAGDVKDIAWWYFVKSGESGKSFTGAWFTMKESKRVRGEEIGCCGLIREECGLNVRS
jgi:hypothetical protein